MNDLASDKRRDHVRLRGRSPGLPSVALVIGLIVVASIAQAQTIPFATYFGSDLDDSILALETDALGNVYTFGTVPAGITTLSTAPTHFFGMLPFLGAPNDCYVGKLVPSQNGALAYSWLAIFHDSRSCEAMAVAPSGEVFVARTQVDERVVIDVLSDTAGLTLARQFVLPQLASANRLRVNDDGHLYAIGGCSTEDFPGELWPLPNGFQPGPAGLPSNCDDATGPNADNSQHLLLIVNELDHVIYGSFFGFGSSQIEPTALEVDPGSRRAYIAGSTIAGAPGSTLITTPNAFQPQPGDSPCDANIPPCGFGDAFLIVVNPALSDDDTLEYASYFGGQGRESAVAMALGSDGLVYLVGNTQSQGTFPGMTLNENAAIFRAVLDINEPPANQLVVAAPVVSGSAASLLNSQQSTSRFRLFPDGKLAMFVSTLDDNTSFPLIDALFSAPRDPNAFGDNKPVLLVHDPAAGHVLVTYLDDASVAHAPHMAIDPAGVLYVAVQTTEFGRSTDGTAPIGRDVLLFGIDGIGAAAANSPPIANAGADQTIVSSSPLGARVLLYSGFSFDPNGDQLTYTWTEGATLLDSRQDPSVELLFTPGQHDLTLTVDDGRGGVASDTMVLTVLPNTTAGGAQTVTPPDSSWNRSSSYLESPVTIRFDDVTSSGFTSLTSRYMVTPVPPTGMQFGSPPLLYDLATSAGFTGDLQVCINYSGQSFARPDSDVRLYQQSSGTWVPLPQANDTATRSVCATTTTLGTFALFTPAAAANEISLLAGQPVMTPFCTRNQGLDPNDGGFATDSSLCNTRGLAYDAAQNYLYFAEAGQADAIRRIDLTTGRITTVAGTGFITGSLDGPRGDPRDDDQNNVDPLTAPINQVLRVALDAQGNLILAEYGAGRIRKVDFAQNRIYTVRDVSAFTQPSALAIDASGAALFSSFAFGDAVVWRLTPGADGVLNGSPDEVLQVVAGNGTNGFDVSLLPPGGIDPLLIPIAPYDLAFGPDGSLYMTGSNGNSAIVRVDPGPDGLIDRVNDTAYLVAGSLFTTEPHFGDGTPATSAALFIPISIAVAPNGDVYVGDTGNPSGATVRKISAVDGVVTGAPDEIITTVAGFHIHDPAFNSGTDLPFSNGDGHALSSIFGANFDLMVMPNGTLLVNDFWQIRRIGSATGGGDTTPPALTLPAPHVVEAEGPNGSVVTFAASAVDDVDGAVAVSCSPASGSLFGFTGAAPTPTVVTCSATDAAGNTASGTFTVTVQDTTPPVVTAPALIVVAATEAAGARTNVPQAPDTALLLDFLAAGFATDIADSSPLRLAAQRVDCNTPSIVLGPIVADTLFGLGQNCVEVAFTDASGNAGRSVTRVDVAAPIGGHVNDPGVAVIATDMNNVVQPVTANFVVLQQRGLLRAVPTAPPAPPAGLMFHGIAYTVTTTALAPSAITVCITESQLGVQQGDRLLLFENGSWVDRTASVDVVASRVCGLPTSVGVYAIARSAVVNVTVAETIVVSDAPAIVPAVVVSISEPIVVNDTPGVLPSVTVAISEQIVVSDGPLVEPQAVVTMMLLPAFSSTAIGDQRSITAETSDGRDPGTRVVLTAQAGDTVRVQFLHPGVANAPLSVLATPGNPLGGSDVIVSLATTSTGVVSSTAAQVAAALNASPAVVPLLSAQTWPGSPGAGIVHAKPLSPFTPVYFAIEGSSTLTDTCLTSVPGRCSITYSRSIAGVDQISGYLDANGNGTLQPDEPLALALSEWFDDVPPILNLPVAVPIVVEAQMPAGAVVTFPVSASDNASAPVQVICSPASGALFPFNGSTPTTTTVNCTAIDASGNADIGEFTVVVEDTTAPLVFAPPVAVAATEPAGARGNVPQAPHTPILQALPHIGTATDLADPNPARVSVQWVACGNTAQVLGPVADTTLYPVGPNCIVYAFRDASGNVGSGGGTLEVSPPIGGPVMAANVAVAATDLNNVPLPVTATFLGLDQPGLLTAVAPPFIPPLPAGLVLVGAPYDIRSTALTPPAAVVCMRPPFGEIAERLLVLEQGLWVDWTDTVHPVTGEICGRPRPLGTFTLVRRDVSALTLTLAPASSIQPLGIPLRLEAIVADSSAPETRVAIRSTLAISVEFRNPMVANSPLSLVIENDGSGAPRNLIVSLATGLAGELRSTAADVANLVTVEVASRVGAGLVTAAWWANTQGEGIVEARPLLPLARLDIRSDAHGPMASCYISTPGICSYEYTRNEPGFELVLAHLDLSVNQVVDGSELTAQADVSWIDVTPPVLTLPADITVLALSPSGTAVSFTVTAFDASDGAVTASCSHASGMTFPISTTTVTCTATDGSGNVASGSFTVTVFAPPGATPSLSLPGNLTVAATSASGAVVTYTATASVGGGGFGGPLTFPAQCAPPSGSTFPVATTTVACSARNPVAPPPLSFPATGTFTVTVLPFVPPPPVLTALSPATSAAGSAGVAISVAGSGFISGATAFWNGTPRPAVVDSATQLTVTIPAADLATTADLTTAQIAVSNPGSVVSNALPFVITGPQILTVDAEVVPAGAHATASNAPHQPAAHGVTATLINDNPASTPATVTVASYGANPVGDGLFAAGGFFDVQVTGADLADSLTAHFYYSNTLIGLAENRLRLLYWNGAAWRPVVGSGGVLPLKDITDDLDGTISGGRFTVTLDRTSVPIITDLGGTLFALVEDEDRVAPVTTFEPSPAANAQGWNNTDVAVMLAATDNLSVARTEFTVNGGGWQTYDGPIVLRHSGIFALRYRSVDGAGNIESTKTRRVSIDKSEPLAIAVALPTVLLPANRTMVDISVLPLALDLLSGVDAVTLVSVTSNDAGMTADDVTGWSLGTKDYRGKLRAERTASGDRRTYTLTYRVTDRAGNEALATALVVVPGMRD